MVKMLGENYVFVFVCIFLLNSLMEFSPLRLLYLDFYLLDLLAELEVLNIRISNADFEDDIFADVALMCSLLKKHGEELDASHKGE